MHVPSGSRARLLLLISFAALSTVRLAGQESVVQILVGSPPDERFEQVFYLASGVELNRAGLDSLRPDSGVPQNTTLDYNQIQPIMERLDARYALIIAYSPIGDELRMRFSLYNQRGADVLAEKDLTAPVDIDLDARIGEAVRAVVEQARVAGRRGSPTRFDGFALETRPEPTVSQTPVEGLEIAAVTQGVFIVGPAADLFRYGVAAAVAGGFAPSFDRIGATFGGRSTFARLFSLPGVTGGDLYLITGGPEVVVGSAFRGPARLAARATGGASLMIVAAGDRTLVKAVPFLDSGVSARLPIGERFSIGIEVNYLVVFEPGFPVMGLIPAISVSVEP